jgi:hypothetical protein
MGEHHNEKGKLLYRVLRKSHAIGQANARLIAAAPELLAALKAWEHWYSTDSTECARDDARECGLRAIAKAEGR